MKVSKNTEMILMVDNIISRVRHVYRPEIGDENYRDWETFVT